MCVDGTPARRATRDRSAATAWRASGARAATAAVDSAATSATRPRALPVCASAVRPALKATAASGSASCLRATTTASSTKFLNATGLLPPPQTMRPEADATTRRCGSKRRRRLANCAASGGGAPVDAANAAPASTAKNNIKAPLSLHTKSLLLYTRTRNILSIVNMLLADFHCDDVCVLRPYNCGRGALGTPLVERNRWKLVTSNYDFWRRF